MLENKDIVTLIHTIQQFSNKAIVKWTRMTEHNLGISPIIVLSELKLRGPQMQTELANTLGLTPGAMTSIANKLIEKNLAERKYNAADRRIIYLEITEEGIAVLKDSQDKGQALHLEIISILSEEELKQFLATYEKLLKNF